MTGNRQAIVAPGFQPGIFVLAFDSYVRRKAHSLQIRIFGLGLLQNWYARVGIFPQRKKILIRRARLRRVARLRIRSPQLQMRQHAAYRSPDGAPMIQQLLELRGGFISFVLEQVCLAALVWNKKVSNEVIC